MGVHDLLQFITYISVLARDVSCSSVQVGTVRWLTSASFNWCTVKCNERHAVVRFNFTFFSLHILSDSSTSDTVTYAVIQATVVSPPYSNANIPAASSDGVVNIGENRTIVGRSRWLTMKVFYAGFGSVSSYILASCSKRSRSTLVTVFVRGFRNSRR